MRPDVAIKCGDYWLNSVGWYGDITITHRYPGGCWSVEWGMAGIPENYQHPALKTGVPVDVYAGGSRIWAGVLAAPQWEDMAFTAEGECRRLERAMAFGDGLAATSDPNDALFWAVGRGAVDAGGVVPTTPVTDTGTTDHLNTIADLYDAYCEQEGKYWFIDQNRRLWIDDLPTSPHYSVILDSGVLGVSDQEYITHFYVRYLGRDLRFHTAIAGDDSAPVRREQGVDITKRGPLGSTGAQNIANRILNRTRPTPGFTNDIEVGPQQLTNMGGTLASLALPRGGHMVRLAGLQDQRGLVGHTDVVLGETTWDVSENVLTLSPLDKDPVEISEVVEAVGGTLS